MKLSQIKTVSKDSLSKAGELPKWIDALLQPLNQFIENVGQALQGQLTFKDNFLCKVTSERLAHGAETEVNPYTSAKQKTNSTQSHDANTNTNNNNILGNVNTNYSHHTHGHGQRAHSRTHTHRHGVLFYSLGEARVLRVAKSAPASHPRRRAAPTTW